MPSSYHGFINEVITDILKFKPNKVLDIGIGFGKWGSLFREYLDIYQGRYHKEDWIKQIDGIEAFEPYIKDHQKYIYSNLYIGDAYEVIGKLDNYDYIYIGDCLEHFERDKAEEMLQKLRKKTNNLLLCVPLTNRWPQDEILDNPYEKHLSIWEESDFKDCSWKTVKRAKKLKKIALIKYENKKYILF